MPSTLRPSAAATHGMPFPWSDEDTAHAAYRLRAYGFTEDQTLYIFERFAAEGVRSIRRLVDSLPSERLTELRTEYDRRELQADARRRGDLVRVRSLRRWPWRTSTSQPLGGALA